MGPGRQGASNAWSKHRLMATSRALPWGSIITQAVVAGLIAGIFIEAYLWATIVLPAHGSLLQSWQWVASTVIGKQAFTSLSFAWLGLLIHLLVAIGWAGGYAYLASTRPYMNQRWYISGPIYGFVVYMFMEIVLLGDNNFVWPASLPAFFNYAVGAHVIFFGMPLAFVVARMDR